MHVRRAIVRGVIIGGTAWIAALALRRSRGRLAPWKAPYDQDVPGSLNNRAVKRLRRGLDESADGLFQRVHELLEDADPPRPDSLLRVRANLAALYTLRAARERAARRDDAARPLLVEAVTILERNDPWSSRMLARAVTNLARLEQTSGDPHEGTRLFERALFLHEEASCASPEEAADTLMALADVHEMLGQPDRADACLADAADLLRNTAGRRRARLGACLSRRAALAHAAGRLVEAGTLYRRALQIKIAALGPRHPSVARSLEDHAKLLRELDRPAEADALEARARPIRARAARRDPLRRVEPLDTFLIPLSA
jgi:hypothetical protein